MQSVNSIVGVPREPPVIFYLRSLWRSFPLDASADIDLASFVVKEDYHCKSYPWNHEVRNCYSTGMYGELYGGYIQ